MIETTNFKRGLYIQFKNEPMVIVDVKFSTPTARGSNMIAKTKLRSLNTGRLFSESIRSGEKFDEVDVEQRPCSFMYSDGERYHFMDGESYEQFEINKEDLGDDVNYMRDGLEGIRCMVVEGRIVGVTVPLTVDLTITETDPAIKGATATAQLKPATLETGFIVQVPPYLTTGEKVRIDTRDGHFVERVK